MMAVGERDARAQGKGGTQSTFFFPLSPSLVVMIPKMMSIGKLCLRLKLIRGRNGDDASLQCLRRGKSRSARSNQSALRLERDSPELEEETLVARGGSDVLAVVALLVDRERGPRPPLLAVAEDEVAFDRLRMIRP